MFLLKVDIRTAFGVSDLLGDMDGHIIAILVDQDVIYVVHANIVAADSRAELRQHVVQLQDYPHNDVLTKDVLSKVDFHDLLVVHNVDAVLHLLGYDVRVVNIEGHYILNVAACLVSSQAVELVGCPVIIFVFGNRFTVQTEVIRLFSFFLLFSFPL